VYAELYDSRTPIMTNHTNSGSAAVRGLSGWCRCVGRGALRFARDRRGGTAVQAIVMLPVIILVFVMSMKLWQTIMVRRSLHTATYLATRYLSLYPPMENPGGPMWMEVARAIINQEMSNNPFVDKTLLNDTFTPIEFTFDAGFACGDKFHLKAQYPVSAMLSEKTSEYPLPMTITRIFLTEERTGEVLCQ
jgi:Flp pilus assembly protein TadG